MEDQIEVDEGLAPLLAAANGQELGEGEPLPGFEPGDSDPGPLPTGGGSGDETSGPAGPADVMTFADRASFLGVRDEVIARVIARLTDDGADGSYRDRLTAETYAASLETRLALIELDKFLSGASEFFASGPGKFLGKLPGMRKGM